MKDLDRQMYNLAGAGFKDILFNTNTANQALRYWGDVLEYMRGNLKLEKLPKSLQSSSLAIRKLFEMLKFKVSKTLRKFIAKNAHVPSGPFSLNKI